MVIRRIGNNLWTLPAFRKPNDISAKKLHFAEFKVPMKIKKFKVL